jgi:hypothetical protein
MAIQSLYPAIKPSLNLDFANTKTLDPRITFTRASTATFYDGKTVAKAEENLLLRSQEFNQSPWTTDRSTITANSTAAPDGTTTADSLLQASGQTVVGGIVQIASISAAQFVLSVFAKPNGKNFLRLFETSTNTGSFFDISTGVLGTVAGGHTAAITAAGNGWYRCSIVFTNPSAASRSFICQLAETNGSTTVTDDGTGIYIWGAQLEQRSSVTAYVPTTTQPITNYIPQLMTAAAGVARFDHNPTTGESLGLLIEEQRANLFLRSEAFDNAYWVKSGATVTANAVVAKDGTLTADKLVATATNAFHGLDGNTISFTSGTTYTISAFAKAGEYGFLRLGLPATAFGSAFTYFNLQTGGLGTRTGGVSHSIESVGNGWYRCSLTATATATTSASGSFIYVSQSDNQAAYTGDGYSGIYIWGAQLEAGGFSTSYVKTEAAQVTRSADAASMTGVNFSSWYRADEGSLYVDMASEGTTASKQHGVFIFGSPETSGIRVANAEATRADMWTTGFVSQAALLATLASPAKGAMAYKTNDIAFSVNGAAVLTDTSAVLPTPVLMRIGWNNIANQGARGHIRKISYYPARLSNTALQALTA